MKKILSIIFAIAGLQSPAQKSTTASTQSFKQPRLVVGIVVDQMRADYIYRYWNLLGDNGFKLLLHDGFECRNTQYNYMPTFTGPGHASIYAGTTPAMHGIIANNWFDRKQNKTIYCTDDTVSCIGCDNKNGKMSPTNLLTTTVGDELKIFTSMKSKVIGVSLKDRASILPAGHAANAAYWFDNISGNFVTSTYYPLTQLPSWVVDFNNAKYPDQYLSRPWTLLYAQNKYNDTLDNSPYEHPYDGELTPVFPHDLPSLKNKNGYELVRKTPFGNTMTKDFALAAIKGEALGRDSIPDLLTISFSATDYVGHQFGTNALETEDTYLRLDRDLADLLQFLNKEIGKENILVFLTADHAALPNPKYLLEHKIPSGWSNNDSIEKEIKSFLQNEYGDSTLLSKYINDQIYLNHLKLDKKINVRQLQRNLAEDLVGHFQVKDAVTAENLNETEFTKAPRSLIQRGYNRTRSGDIALIYESGIIEPIFSDHTGTTHGSPYNYDTQVPLLWYGWNIKHGNSTRKIDITDIAPTVSTFLHINFPSGCTGVVIEELFK